MFHLFISTDFSLFITNLKLLYFSSRGTSGGGGGIQWKEREVEGRLLGEKWLLNSWK